MGASTKKAFVCIVTPALADANNGNWQTARRWAGLLGRDYRVSLRKAWVNNPQDEADVLVALHARRSAASINAWAAAHADRPLVLVLTGTDLYRDIECDEAAKRSLALAHRLVVLQTEGIQALPQEHRHKARVVYQSVTGHKALQKTARHLRAVMVGHLREEKMPETVWAAARLLGLQEGIHIDHIGGALDPALGDMARQTMAACPHYRWLGALSHEATRSRIQRAHALVHPSRMEGGAHVIMEAVRSATPVLASRIPGNVGMLGVDYAGYFDTGDAQALASLLRACRDGLGQPGSILARLQAQCELRAPLFEPQAERAALLALLQELLPSPDCSI
jgi:putative glycosyltransferase (TIGR04348 family)